MGVGASHVPRGAHRLLRRDQHVGAAVLHRLELADGTAELLPHLGVGRGRVEAPGRAAGRLGRDHRRSQVADEVVGDAGQRLACVGRGVHTSHAPRGVEAGDGRDVGVGPIDDPPLPRHRQHEQLCGHAAEDEVVTRDRDGGRP